MDINTRITIIIVTYYSEDKIYDCLSALYDAIDKDEIRCIVVDNNSKDQTASIVRENFPKVLLIENDENSGYGRGMNLGFEKTDTEYTIFMNPDAIISYANIKILEEFMDNTPEAGMAAPSIEKSNKSYQVAGNLAIPKNIIKAFLGMKKELQEILPDSKPFETNWICGAIMFCRTELIKRLNGFDPTFFLYFEETDLCYRVMRSGYSLWAIGESKAYHASNSSARKVNPELKQGGCLYEHFYPSRFYYIKKNFGLLAAILVDLFELLVYGTIDIYRFTMRKERKKYFITRRRYPSFHIPL